MTSSAEQTCKRVSPSRRPPRPSTLNCPLPLSLSLPPRLFRTHIYAGTPPLTFRSLTSLLPPHSSPFYFTSILLFSHIMSPINNQRWSRFSRTIAQQWPRYSVGAFATWGLIDSVSALWLGISISSFVNNRKFLGSGQSSPPPLSFTLTATCSLAPPFHSHTHLTFPLPFATIPSTQ